MTSLTIFLNAIFLYAVFKNKNLGKTLSVLLIVLSSTDLFTGAIVFPINASQLLLSIEDKQTCQLIAFSYLSGYSLGGATVICLLLITIDRYLSVIHTYWHERHITKRRLLLVYLLAVLMYEPEVILSSYTNRTAQFVIGLTSCGIISYIIMLYCYIRLFWEVNKIRKRTIRCGVNNSDNRNLLSSIKAMKTTFCLLGSTGICYTPLLSYLLYISVRNGSVVSRAKYHFLWGQAMWLSNSFLNAVVYYWRMSEARRTMKLLLCGRYRG